MNSRFISAQIKRLEASKAPLEAAIIRYKEKRDKITSQIDIQIAEAQQQLDLLDAALKVYLTSQEEEQPIPVIDDLPEDTNTTENEFFKNI